MRTRRAMGDDQQACVKRRPVQPHGSAGPLTQGTRQRQVAGELGKYRLNLGDGYLIHGTPHAESVGEASSHGCMRLGDEDIACLYEHVPVGTPVYTY